MTTSFRVHLPDGDKVVTCRFDLMLRQVELEHEEDHYLLLGFEADGHLFASTGYPCEGRIGHDPIGEVSHILNVSPSLAEVIVTQFLSLVGDEQVPKALETYHLKTLPLLRDLQRERPMLEIPRVFDRRLHDALAAPNPKVGAARFWAEDEVGPKAAKSFMSSLVDTNRLSGVRAAWLGLAPQTLRHELLDAPLATSPLLWPLPSWREMLVDLQPRTCVAFVKHAMTDGKAISVLATAAALGLRASGRDHVRAYNDLYAAVLRADYGRPASLAALLIAKGVAGEKVSLLATRQDCVVAGESLKNCLSNSNMSYKQDILDGRKTVVAIGDDWGKGAIAIDTRTQRIVEKRGYKNAPLPAEYEVVIQEIERQWQRQQAKNG
jgi:hypothetical protein